NKPPQIVVADATTAICGIRPATRITRPRRGPSKFRQTTAADRPPRQLQLPRFEAPLVDVQSLDLRLQRRRRDTEPPGGAEGPGHAALAVLERRLDGVPFVGRQRAGGEAGDRRGPRGPTGEPPGIDRERVRITHDHRALDD